MLTNEVSAGLSSQDLSDIQNAITVINTKMPFLIGLSEQDRRECIHISESNKKWIDDVLNIFPTIASAMPGYIDKNEMEVDRDLFEQLKNIEPLIRDLSSKMSDTMVLAGHEAYVSALSIYKATGQAAKLGLPGCRAAYDQMSVRFAKQGNRIKRKQGTVV